MCFYAFAPVCGVVCSPAHVDATKQPFRIHGLPENSAMLYAYVFKIMGGLCISLGGLD